MYGLCTDCHSRSHVFVRVRRFVSGNPLLFRRSELDFALSRSSKCFENVDRAFHRVYIYISCLCGALSRRVT